MPNFFSFESVPLVTKAGGLAIVRGLKAADAWTVATKGPTLRCYKNDPPLTQAMDLADLEECDFSGYAEFDLTNLAATFVGPAGIAVQVYDPTDFTGGNPLTVPGLITGVYLTNAANTELWAVQRMAEIYSIDDVGDWLQVIMQLPFPPSGPGIVP